jgi:hypothetical protein
MALVLLIIALVALDLLALRYGSESRPGFEGHQRPPRRPELAASNFPDLEVRFR